MARMVLKSCFVHFSLLNNNPCHPSTDEFLAADGKHRMSEHMGLA